MLRYVAGVLITVMAATAGEGAEVKILAALAVQDALGPIGASFSRDSGHTAQIAYSTVGAIRQRLAAGERADVVILTAEAVDDMARLGQLSNPMARRDPHRRRHPRRRRRAGHRHHRAVPCRAPGGALGRLYGSQKRRRLWHLFRRRARAPGDRRGRQRQGGAAAGQPRDRRGCRQGRGRTRRHLHQHDCLDAGPEGGRSTAAAALRDGAIFGRPSRRQHGARRGDGFPRGAARSRVGRDLDRGGIRDGAQPLSAADSFRA